MQILEQFCGPRSDRRVEFSEAMRDFISVINQNIL